MPGNIFLAMVTEAMLMMFVEKTVASLHAYPVMRYNNLGQHFTNHVSQPRVPRVQAGLFCEH